MAEIKKTIFINTPLEKVYAFARDPELWNSWWPNLSAPEQIIGNGGKGTTVKHHYTMAGIAFPIISTVVEDTPGPKTAHWIGEFNGPLKGTHEWSYAGHTDGTQVTVRINYTVPGQALGKIADRFILEKMEERAIETTLENLKLLCESEVPVNAY